MNYKACPCLHTTPCQPNCTCVKPMMSNGCHRCCTYGSKEQQKAMAECLAKFIDEGFKTMKKEVEHDQKDRSR